MQETGNNCTLFTGLSMNSTNPPLPRVVPTKLEELKETPKSEPVNKEVYAKQIEEMQQKFQDAFKAPVSKNFNSSSASSSGSETYFH